MRPVINPLYPIDEVPTVEALMDIAVGMEHEAAERYDQLRVWMQARGDAGMAALFARMAELERGHEAGLGRWAMREGRRRPLPAHFAWSMPETFDDTDAGSLTPYRALGIAVRNEERAFTFYAYLAAMADDAEVRSRAEALAREELNHVAELRRLRRSAFHLQPRRPGPARRARTLAELHEQAAGLAWGAARVTRAAAAALDVAGEREVAVLVQVEAPPSTHPGSPSAEAAQAAGLLVPNALTPEGALDLALRDADETADSYMSIAEQAADEPLMREAQTLAEQAMGRAAMLRGLLDARRKRGGSPKVNSRL